MRLQRRLINSGETSWLRRGRRSSGTNHTSLSRHHLEKSQSEQGDTKGTHTMLWLALADFDNSAVSNEEVDAKLDAWEEQSARIRKEARRLQREVAAET